MKNEPGSRPAGLFGAVKMIFWAFFGVRRRQHSAFDAAQLTPLQIVVAGILGGVVFVLVLMVVVRAVVMGHGAVT